MSLGGEKFLTIFESNRAGFYRESEMQAIALEARNSLVVESGVGGNIFLFKIKC
jgi:hypothetical protein